MKRAAALALLLAIACSREPAPVDSPAISPEWVTLYDSARAANGYTLTLHQARTPVLLDLNGRLVHSWPQARLKSRVRFLPDGSILGIGLGRQVVEYDWKGKKTWQFPTPDAIPHHDVIRLANGNTLVLVLREGEGTDTLLEVDRAGKVVWTWRAAERLGPLLPEKPANPRDVTHFNSLQELPQNPWAAAGDARFRPGNLLVSARNLNTVFVIDRASGEVVWHYAADLDRQHEALLLPSGRIQIFNNRSRSFAGDRQSEILEIDPRDGRVLWRFKQPGFFTPTAGTQQPLANGNLLLTSTRGGRVFEITRSGETVWQWVPPYEPVRAVRLAPDASPQLARLSPPKDVAVALAPDARHVDRDAYRFARQGSRRKVRLDGVPRVVLAEKTDCRELLLPVGARMQVGYGVDRGKRTAPVGFTVWIGKTELLRDRIGREGHSWRERTIPLDRFALQSVRLCLEIEGGGSGRDRSAYWAQPILATPRDRIREEASDDDAAPGDLTPEELEVRRKHLKSLGYVG